MVDDATIARRTARDFVLAVWSIDRQCHGAGGQSITYHTCPVCHEGFAGGSTACGWICEACRKAAREILREQKEDVADRRKAMAEAMRAKDTELHNRPHWDSAGRWLELAEAADVAAQETTRGADVVRVFWWVAKDIREAKYMLKIWPGLAAGGFKSREEAQNLIDTNPEHAGDVPVKIVVTMIEDRKEAP